MAKKSNKATIGDQYREILASYGKRLEDCKILAFSFNCPEDTALFHYGLMSDKPDYFFYDCTGTYAAVVSPKDEQNAAKIVSISERIGGRQTTPILL